MADYENTPIRTVGIGLGDLGTHLLNAANDHEYSTVVAGYDAFERPRQQFVSDYPDAIVYNNLDAMIEEEQPDAAIIATAHGDHYEQTKKTISNGIHTLVEKPLVTDIDHAAELTELAQKHDVVAQEGLQRHLHDGYQTARETQSNGQIGDVTRAEAKLWQPGWESSFWDTWRTDTDLAGGGELYDSGQHVLDALLWTTASSPQTVDVEHLRYIDEVRDLPDDDQWNRDQVDVTAAFEATLEHPDGYTFPADVEVHGAPAPGEEAPDNHNVSEYLRIVGTNGELMFDSSAAEALAVYTEDDGLTMETYSDDEVGYMELIDAKIDAFNREIRGEDTMAATLEDGRKVVNLTEAVYVADEHGEPVNIEEFVAGNYATPVADD